MYILDNFQLNHITISDTEIKKILCDKLSIDINKAKNDINNALNIYSKRKQNCTDKIKNEWIMCIDKCNDVIKNYMKKELNSTIYVLKCLADSVISINKELTKNIEYKLSITEIDKLTGIWKDDNKYINIETIGNENNKNSRLIMGFGPSASGKTYWAQNIISIFNEIDSNFPKTFISIDGGLYRQSSEIYKLTIESAKSICAAGFLNLVLSGISILHHSLFKSNSIKKDIYNYLLNESKNIKISLYVPETLGDCGEGITDLRLKNCKKKYSPYIKITNDNKWIGLLIWQHRKGSDCNYQEKYNCVGCTESGKAREISEGKKYSNSAWGHSMKMGIIEVKTAPGGAYMIHNSGGKKTNNKYNKTIIQDISKTDSDEEIEDIFQNNQTKYNYLYSKTFDFKI